MELIEIIEKRRSCKKFLSKPVEQYKLDQIITAGLYASSGRNLQSPIVIQITNKELLAKIEQVNAKVGGFKHGSHPFYNAPVVLFVAASKNVHTTVYDGSLAAGYMLLEASNLGLGGCWIHRAKETLLEPEGRKMFQDLGLNPDEYEGIGNIIIGYPDPTYVTPDKQIKPNRVYKVE